MEVDETPTKHLLSNLFGFFQLTFGVFVLHVHSLSFCLSEAVLLKS